jgi:BirA family biotin operon repressor/biotin-[acetyl-CoA-carboxylase] ligase
VSGETQRLRDALAARGLGGGVVERHVSLGSTNDRARELAREGAPEWSVVLADVQTGGRGRQGRRWASAPGGLYVSVVLRPTAPVAELLPLCAGCAVADALHGLGLVAELKWPNDVLLQGRKVAGLLAEASSSRSGIEWVVLGLGLNLAGQLPDELAEVATTIERAGGPVLAPDAAAALVFDRLGVWYHALRTDPPSVVAAWRERSVAWWGSEISVRMGEATVRGLARDVDPRGALLLDLADGRSLAVLAGDVIGVRIAPGEGPVP